MCLKKVWSPKYLPTLVPFKIEETQVKLLIIIIILLILLYIYSFFSVGLLMMFYSYMYSRARLFKTKDVDSKRHVKFSKEL